MGLNMLFVVNSIMLGVGLAMDAFSVSLANGLNEPKMSRKKMCIIAGVFAFFQALMPMIGWFCVHNIVKLFRKFEPIIPWIALILLLFIGGKMLSEGVRGSEEEEASTKVGLVALLIQGIATSIDALSVGFTMCNFLLLKSIICALIIAAVTFVICMVGVIIGKKFGMKLSRKATIFGGIILIFIGIEIFITGIM